MKSILVKFVKYKVFLLLIILTYSFNLWAQNQTESLEFNSLQYFYSITTADLIENNLKLAKGTKIQSLSRSNLVARYKDTISGIEYIEKTYDYLNDERTNEKLAKREYFAYQLDKKIGLKLVPPTIYFQDPTNKKNYIVRQLYICNSISVEEKKSDLKYNLNGTALPVFDQLIGSSDRNFNNFLISKDGTVTAIDHEAIFTDAYLETNPNFKKEEEVKAFFYNKEIWGEFERTNWKDWAESYFPQGDDDIKLKFLENIKKLTKKAYKIMNSDASFFQSAQALREEGENIRKQIFDSDNEQLKTPKRRIISIPSC